MVTKGQYRKYNDSGIVVRVVNVGTKDAWVHSPNLGNYRIPIEKLEQDSVVTNSEGDENGS